jgi:hypothetical protein
MICGTLSSTLSEFIASASSIEGEIKNLVTLVGSEDLKSSRAAQHLLAVDQGATYFFPS